MGRKRTEGWGYERAGIVAIDDVLPLILDPEVKKVTFCGHAVNVVSLRLQTFATKGICCSNCGLTATHFAVERNEGNSWHLNLWADRSAEGKGEMLMTHDHTLARGLGGADHIDNVTTMCRKCNFNKSIGERQEFNRRHPEKTTPKKTVERDRLPVEIGTRVRKTSGNKFKSGEHVATVAAYCSSLMDPRRRMAYVLEEDDSIVCIGMCKAVPA